MKLVLLGGVSIAGILLAQGVVSSDEFLAGAEIQAEGESLTSDGPIVVSEIDSGTTSATVTEAVISESGLDLGQVSGYARSRHFVVRDEGDFMRYLSSVVYGVESKTLNPAIFPNKPVALPAASTTFTFTIAAGAMPVSIRTANAPSAAEVSFSISLEEVGSGTLYKYDGSLTSDDESFSDTLDPGTYSVSCSIAARATSQINLERSLLLEMTVGEEPEELPALPAPGEFTHPDIFTERAGDDRLLLSNPTIVSSADLGDGQTEIRFFTEVKNVSGAAWNEVLVSLNPGTVVEDVEVLSPFPPFAITGNATSSPGIGNELILTVPSDSAAELTAQLLDGSALAISGAQVPVFCYPVRPIGPDDVPGGSTGAVSPDGFIVPEVPLVSSGGVLLEWEPFYEVPIFVNITDDFPPLITQQQGFDFALPLLVADVRLFGNDFEMIPFEVNGRPFEIDLTKVLKHGRVVEEITPEAHPEDLGVTQIPESRGKPLGITGLFPSPIPLHFNQIEVSSGIEVSGSFGFKPELIGVTLEMENFVLKELTVQSRYQADVNLLLETEEGADNTNEPVAGREKTLLDLELFRVQLATGLDFAPRLVIKAGALVNAPTSLSMPITSGVAVDLTAGVRDNEAVYEQEVTPLLPRVSDPGFYEAFNVEAEAYLDCEIKALIAGAGGVASTGPTLGVRAEATAILQPLEDPWWEICGKVSAFAGVELSLFEVLTLVDEEKTLETWDLFAFDAGGPLLAGPAGKSAVDPAPGFAALGDDRTRWIRSLVPGEKGLAASSRTFAIDLEGTDDVIIGGGNPGIGVLARLSPKGQLVWSSEQTFFYPLAGVADAAGGFTVLDQQRGKITVANFNEAGEVVWSKVLSGTDGLTWFQSQDLAHRVNGEGASEYFVLGTVLPGFHSAVAKLDSSGSLVWLKSYPLDPAGEEGTASEPRRIEVLADGDLIVVGGTQANIDPTTLASYNITQNGLAMKISANDGVVLWTQVLGERYAMTFHAVAEAADGSLYLGGNSSGNVLDDMPALLLSKLTSDGEVIETVFIGASPLVDSVMHGGETDFDTIYDMAWVDDSLWICGQMGLFNGGSVGGVAEGASAFTAMLDEKFHVSRFAVHGGPATESFRSLLPTNDGLLLTGPGFSFHPWPTGSEEGDAASPGSILAVSMPWEGRVRFHSASSGASKTTTEAGPPTAGTFFITPRVRAASQYTLATNQSNFAGLGQRDLTYFLSVRPEVQVGDHAMTSGAANVGQAVTDPGEFKALEFMPESLITNYETWQRWWQVSDQDDADGDGIPPEVEFFLGASPAQNDELGITWRYLADEDKVQYSLPRAKLASTMVPALFSSESLTFENSPREDVTLFTEFLDEKRDLLFLEVPASENSNFYRLRLPE